jgi:hypothetical protein
MSLNSKGQSSIFVKLLFTVIASVLFFIVIMQFTSFRLSTVEEKASSNFKIQVLNTLQKLVTDPNCLAYQQNETPYKVVIDKSKLDYFVTKYNDVEPDCAKALEFDYNIIVEQFSYNFSTYPGTKIKEGECAPRNGIAVHPTDPNYLIVCDKDLSEEDVRESCCSGGDTDPYLPGPWPCSGGITVHCSRYDCTKFLKSEEECEDIDETTTEKVCCVRKTCVAHPKFVECYNIDPKTECIEVHGRINGMCGQTGRVGKVAVGVTTNVSISKFVYSFGVASGVSSFSPQKAKLEEIKLSLPIVIRHNETFYGDGIIFIYAVRGELETFVSTLEDICQKAVSNPSIDIKFSKKFKFSYPVEYFPSTNSICMLSSCKKFICPYSLEFYNITTKGEYFLDFVFNSSEKTLSVTK